MHELYRLMDAFLSEKMSAEEFTVQFFSFWERITEEQHEFSAKSSLFKRLVNLFRRDSQLHTQAVTIPAFSKADDLLNDVFTVVEQYEPDPEVRGTQYTDEIQLKMEIRPLFEKLKTYIDIDQTRTKARI